MCLTSPGGTAQNLGNLTQAPCSGSSLQQFIVSQTIENIGCTTSGNNWVWSWDATTTGPYHVMVTQGASTTELATTGTSASGATLPYSTTSGWAQGTYDVTFIDGNSTTVATGTITIASRSRNNSCQGLGLQ